MTNSDDIYDDRDITPDNICCVDGLDHMNNPSDF